MITKVAAMSVDHARCLAMAYQLHHLLGELYDRPEGGPGSPIEDAWNRMDDVIGMLEPDEHWPVGPNERGNVTALRRKFSEEP
jgi:hypothetical protein